MSSVKDRRSCSVRDDTGFTPSRFSDNTLRVLEARYLKKDESGTCIETPADLFRRVAGAVADAELLYDSDAGHRSEWEDRFFDLMMAQRFMPNSPTLMNAGRPMGMLSACFVLPVPDSIEGIFDSIKYTALIQKAGGGTGFAFDELRPTGDLISSSGGTTSGPISFWRAFSESSNAIQQGAFRRGANMAMMNIHHPDILKFLHAKEDLDNFTNYNISVKITDEWMDSFQADPQSYHVVRNVRTGQRYLLPRSLSVWQYDLRWLRPVDHDVPTCGDFYTKQDIWDIIVTNAWRTGEPGVAFIDRINESNPTPHIGRIESTNPCGEQPLLPFESCNLGSINLGRFITHPCTAHANVAWEALRRTVHQATRFLDDVIDANKYPLPQIDRICKANRKIGLGLMGFADALYMLGVGYNSAQAVDWGTRFMSFINDAAHDYSERLARQRGSFPNWKGSVWDTVHHRPMRNATCTTVAPTGTISIIAGCSCGIEPLYSLAFHRNVLRDQEAGTSPMVEINSVFQEVAQSRGLLSEELMDQIARDGTLAGIHGIHEDIRRVFVCAHDVSPEWHIKMQAAFQTHCDAAISKTINFSKSAVVQDVDTIFRQAYRLRCKGLTVYRNGSRNGQPMTLTRASKQVSEASQPAHAPGQTRQAGKRGPQTGDGGPAVGPAFQPVRDRPVTDRLESRSHKEPGGGNGHGRASPIPVIENPLWSNTGRKARLLNGVLEPDTPAEQHDVLCPDCRTPLRFAEACVKCEDCGFAHC
ncbi:MAG: adenosylcobalamin-dependent ribonucleoside-diphosphate reductase [Phycisphaerae bacterium]